MKNYGVLKGKAKQFTRDDDDKPHSELLMEEDGTSYRVAINVRSSRGASHRRLVEYLILHDVRHPLVDHARSLPPGWSDLQDGERDEAAIDYIRSNIFRATDIKPLTHFAPGPDNDLFEHIEALFKRAIDDENALVYAFGERWGPEDDKQDQYFSFLPGNGVHLIHMNQGGAGDAHGTYRDGALLFDFPDAGTATALFLKFQNQVWHTEESNAAPIADAPAVPVIPIPASGEVETWDVVAPDSPYHLARIIAAMVNPRNAEEPGHETVTVLNISGQSINLNGWSILDQRDKADPLPAMDIEPGHAAVVRLSGEGARLSNKGGTITLLNERGLKVDGVAYTEDMASIAGTPVVFS